MSRSGYTDDYGDDDPLAMGRWRQAVKRSIEGKRGQAMLRELAEALDAMPDKSLSAGNFATVEGEFCTLGVLGAKRGTKMDDLGDDEDGCDTETVGQRFGIARALAAEIMYMNDESVDEHEWVDVVICGPMPPYHFQPYGHKRHDRTVRVALDPAIVAAKRWQRMRKWVADNLATGATP
jgi:hypothetical protein